LTTGESKPSRKSEEDVDHKDGERRRDGLDGGRQGGHNPEAQDQSKFVFLCSYLFRKIGVNFAKKTSWELVTIFVREGVPYHERNEGF